MKTIKNLKNNKQTQKPEVKNLSNWNLVMERIKLQTIKIENEQQN